jgi:threonine/homoserine/homoserine lactone efflux protein
MTLQKLSKYANRFAGFLFIFMGLSWVVDSAYIYCVDDRTKMILISALQIPGAVVLIWYGIKRIREPNEQRNSPEPPPIDVAVPL